MLVSVRHMLSHDMDYHDLGGARFLQFAPPAPPARRHAGSINSASKSPSPPADAGVTRDASQW
ncbi:hypothetical protein C3486_02370 [Streptomyces sp. Ru73]|uniref:hypothetical protein n=1 Tax=Streptomyces sp. Ru73 TaxID=2080748 RepID=UPI000CDE0300|nr:hypothetical protein [Streptomyces sp. Ru73]POX43080.1 hypothetical protein C3486_02370 [Streptomyces sp. Ru73]